MTIPYGLWSSPIYWETLSAPPLSFLEVQVDRESVYWIEVRPEEKGRNALMRYSKEGVIQEKFPFMNVQTRVHEYGGGAFYVEESNLIFFDAKTNALYLETDEQELVLLAQDSTKRFANFSFSPGRKKIVCVCEDHTDEKNVANYLVLIDVATRTQTILEQGAAFYASPQFSPDGKCCAFLSWEFPHMPWEECALTVLSLDDDFLVYDKTKKGRKGESITQFIWVGLNTIVFASDLSGFWNLYLYDQKDVRELYAKQVDFAGPLWTLGKKSFAFFYWQGRPALLCTICAKAVDSLCIITLEDGKVHEIPLPFCVVRTLAVSPQGKGYFIGGAKTQPLSLVELDLSLFTTKIIRQSFLLSQDIIPFISAPEEVSTKSSLDGEDVYGFYYPPKNPFCSANKEDKPPLLIRCHSGPTFHASPLLSLELQFWTSRGFAVLDVNYRGSTGYGKAYRDKLQGQWGIVDVKDCLDLALNLVSLGRVNRQGLFVKGGSSGGFTALLMASLGVAKGCVSYYGVTDLSLLLEDTHKFERCYLDGLVGDRRISKELYKERSPISHPNKISCPVLFFHGENDCIVPLSQAQNLCKQLQHGKIVVFPEEGHSFKQASTIQTCLNVELEFYLELLELKQNKPI